MRTEALISPMVRSLHYYTVMEAGAKIGLKRQGSYDAVASGLIPTERRGRFHLVPRKQWDAIVKNMLRKS